MYTHKKLKPPTTGLKVNQSKQGETIEQKVRRIVNNKEPIKDGAPIIFTERKEGVLPQFDIRTDKHEIAVEVTDLAAKNHTMKRADAIKAREEQNKPQQPTENQKNGETPANTNDQPK